jgi:uncharacterized membrane protein YgdD (TMEM256/DUF423 family)
MISGIGQIWIFLRVMHQLLKKALWPTTFGHMIYARIATLALAIAVVLGSIGAHGLQPHLSPEAYNSWETAAKYQYYQSLGLLALAVAHLSGVTHPKRMLWALRIISLGMVFFCLSLYLRSSAPVTGMDFTWLGPVAPIGGLLFIAGWLLAAFSFVSKSKQIG